MRSIVALFAGVLFGMGLMLGGMTDPAKVIGFLDLAGRWDPSLAFVMGGALCVTLPAFQLLLRRGRPLLEQRFFMPTRTDLDARLIGGAVLFGVGWGIAGLCPGPAVANLAFGSPQVLAFVAAMIVGMWLRDRVASPGAPLAAPAR
ncbi:MAG: DUF6691 family protein [Panacagrimonas sp.]